jgi:hypothetical protein
MKLNLKTLYILIAVTQSIAKKALSVAKENLFAELCFSLRDFA